MYNSFHIIYIFSKSSESILYNEINNPTTKKFSVICMTKCILYVSDLEGKLWFHSPSCLLCQLVVVGRSLFSTQNITDTLYNKDNLHVLSHDAESQELYGLSK